MLGLEPQRLTTGLPLYTGDGGVLEVSIIEYEGYRPREVS